MCVHDRESNTIDVIIDMTTDSEHLLALRPPGSSELDPRRAATALDHSVNGSHEHSAEAFLLMRLANGTAYALHGEARPTSMAAFLSSTLVPSPGRVIGGRYRLVAPLASGGMGSVWTAYHIDLDTPVAIKLMAPMYGASSQERTRFMREARAAARLRSRNVVAVLDYGVDTRTQYIVMERLHGEDLWTRLNRQRCVPVRELARILDSIANALELAHGAGIVHRDLKPENIFLARVAGEVDEVVKVLDFGIAKDLNTSPEDEKTPNGVVIGTPQYMSPEQASGMRSIDHRTDLWSLGVILFRALTGRLPFENVAITEIIDAIVSGQIPTPSSIAGHLSVDVDRFFERALARDRGARFHTIGEMTEAFHRLMPASTQCAGYSPPQSDAIELSSGHFIALSAPQLDAWACGCRAASAGPISVTQATEDAVASPAPRTPTSASSTGFSMSGRRAHAMWLVVGALALLVAALLVELSLAATG